MDFSRRDLLKWGTAAAATWAAGTTLCGAEGRRRRRACTTLGRRRTSASTSPSLGLQLYSVRTDCEKDLPGVLKAVAEMGYEGVEFAGYYGRTADELKELLDKNGLRCCGSHVRVPELLGDELQKTVEFSKTIGNRYLIVSAMGPDRLGTVEKIKDTARLFTEVSEKIRPEGMYVGYHAHGHDFHKLGDTTPWELFFFSVGPDVTMQLDTGNCLDGGGDPYAILRKFPCRSRTIHLKEHGGKHGAPIGEGVVKWAEVFELCESIGNTQWYIAEQEAYAVPPMESVRQCIENLRRMGK